MMQPIVLHGIGRRSGKPDAKDYGQSPAYLELVAPVVAKLNTDIPAAQYNATGLAELSLQVQQFQEELMGKDSIKRHPKIPAALFRDFSPTGALYTLAVKCHSIKVAKDLKKIDWTAPARKRENFDIVAGIASELNAKGQLVWPRVWIDPALPAETIARLRNIVTKLKGAVVEASNDATVTHRVMNTRPNENPKDGRDNKSFARFLEKRGGDALVHWLFLPDSYDEVVPTSSFPKDAQPQPAPARRIPWRVHVTWVIDSEKYNEWMNAMDYALPDPVAAPPAAVPLSVRPTPQLSPQKPLGLPTQPGASGARPLGAPGASGAVAPLYTTLPAGVMSLSTGPVQPGMPGQQRSAPADAGPNTQASAAAGSAPAAAVQGVAPGAAAAAGAGATGTSMAAQPGAAALTQAALKPTTQLPVQARPPQPGAAQGQVRPLLPGQTVQLGVQAGSAPPAKRQRAEVRPEVSATGGVRVAPNVVRQQVVEPHKLTMELGGNLENLSQGQLHSATVGSRKPPLAPAPPQPYAQTLLPAAAAGLAQAAGVDGADPANGSQQPERQAQETPEAQELAVYAIPMHAAWFNPNGISDKERNALPEFSSSTDTARSLQGYKELRDKLVALYRSDPARRLTLTEARASLRGDTTLLYRVWAFLDTWGIINYRAPPSTGQRTHAAMQAQAATIMTQTQAPNPSNVYAAPNPRVAEAVGAAASHGGPYSVHRKPSTAATVPSALRAAQASHGPGARPRYYCSAMPWVECSELRYHCTKLPDVDLCPRAFAEGRFPPGTCTKDFVRIASATGRSHMAGSSEAQPEGAWLQQETLLLLEGIKLYNDNWAEIATHVGERTQVECIMHFLQLPIEEQLLEESESPPQDALVQQSGIIGYGAAGIHKAGQHAAVTTISPDHVPFGDAANPVMANIGLLASIMGPRVAAAAAQKSLYKLSTFQGAVSSTPESTTQQPFTQEQLRAAAAEGLQAAAAKARSLAVAEERETRRLVGVAVEQQSKKLELRLKYMADVEQMLSGMLKSQREERDQMDTSSMQALGAKYQDARA